jgi:hypothetical protein
MTNIFYVFLELPIFEAGGHPRIHRRQKDLLLCPHYILFPTFCQLPRHPPSALYPMVNYCLISDIRTTNPKVSCSSYGKNPENQPLRTVIWQAVRTQYRTDNPIVITMLVIFVLLSRIWSGGLIVAALTLKKYAG